MIEKVIEELKMSFRRLGYFLRQGRLHPDLQPHDGIWPEIKIIKPPEGITGTFTLSYGGMAQTFRHDLVLLEDSDNGTNWALQWANSEAA